MHLHSCRVGAGGCGSCYAFSSAGMLEARFRVLSNNTQTPVLSPQDIVECCNYSQGCEGGFPYLVAGSLLLILFCFLLARRHFLNKCLFLFAGKYGEDFGWVAEASNPYLGTDGKCRTPASAPRYYATKYAYVGGYYGACSEEVHFY